MRFTPKTENEIASANLWPAGEYDFEVIKAEDTASKAGNDMTALTVRIFDIEGKHRQVLDYLVDSVNSAYKTRHFAEATGMMEQYDKGEMLAFEMVGRTGRCKVNVQKDHSGQYPDKNGIADYIKAGAGSAPTPRVATREELDDVIPF